MEYYTIQVFQIFENTHLKQNFHHKLNLVLLLIDVINITINFTTHCISTISFDMIYENFSSLILLESPWIISIYVVTLSLVENIYSILPFSLPTVSLKSITIVFIIAINIIILIIEILNHKNIIIYLPFYFFGEGASVFPQLLYPT